MKPRSPFTAIIRRIYVMLALVPTMLVSSLISASAHEVRPGYLEFLEETAGEFSVLFKTPMQGDARLALAAVLSGEVELIAPIVSRPTGDAMVQTWRVRAVEPLAGQTLLIEGLRSSMTDVLVRIEFANGNTWTERLTPGAPEATIPSAPTGWATAITYFHLGVEHILFGFDHLLFVLALIIITKGKWLIVKTITAFTVAHSITLAMATLGFVHIPGPPVEAVIALSIVFVAMEIVGVQNGRTSLAAQAPWLVAFAFGLLHGFGFAGALSEIGLPQGQIPVALLFFNLGVETGQLLFVGLVLGLAKLLLFRKPRLPNWLTLMPPYAIGTLAMFWVIERIAAF